MVMSPEGNSRKDPGGFVGVGAALLTTFYPWRRSGRRSPNLAFIALARKLLTILNAIARERVAWQP
jgi:hypothetical protein